MLNALRCGLAAALFALASCQPVLAQMRCAQTKAMLDGLKERYGEEPMFAGTMTGANGAPMLITVLLTGTWSLLVAGPRGQMLCLAFTGDNWSARSPKADKPGEDT